MATSASTGLTELYDKYLPLNRKEVYFTATVLPAIICADGFEHFDRFLKLLKLESIPIKADPAETNIQFFTEYSLAEAIVDQEDPRFADFSGKRERPDLVILITDTRPTLIAIEAKMYDATKKSDLIDQMKSQEEEVLSRFRTWKPEPPRIIHAALLPKEMKDEFASLDNGEFLYASIPRPIITWEEIRDNFLDVKSAEYFIGVLKIALDKFTVLRGDSKFEKYADKKHGGVDIVAGYLRGGFEFQMMGRKGGIDGSKLRHDINSGEWWQHPYEVKISAEERPNWFPISRFVEIVTRAQET